MKRTAASFGSISSGTLRAEDLIPEFAYELRRLRGSLPRNIAKNITAFNNGKLEFDESELVDALMDELNQFAPPYAYFGAHIGDGADFGFWLSEDLERDFDGLRVNDTSEIPRDYTGEVLFINDHGNITLFAARKGKLREIWSVV